MDFTITRETTGTSVSCPGVEFCYPVSYVHSFYFIEEEKAKFNESVWAYKSGYKLTNLIYHDPTLTTFRVRLHGTKYTFWPNASETIYGIAGISLSNNSNITEVYINGLQHPQVAHEYSRSNDAIFKRIKMSVSTRATIGNDRPTKVGMNKYEYKAPEVFDEFNEEYHWVLTSINGEETIVNESGNLILSEIKNLYSIKVVSENFISQPLLFEDVLYTVIIQ
ncbi:hypothetical protein [Flammeovirga aprica]|uniref:Uncharacterized protein n=1 Tax=Flammeovirga aprica JL-4 TaxID=694437 RepID=A0A7X9RZ64_9BACT|nr:hypothetical protein [Flammeovirga aprica]NME71492.1 hypothetical protein [Flammeovirga aprica JL-4]